MTDLLLLVTLLIWVPLIPLRLVIQSGISLWRKLGDLSFWIFFVWWAGIDILVLAERESLSLARFEPTAPGQVIGIVLVILSLLFGYWTAQTLGLVTLSTRPQVSPDKSRASLIVSGPYRLIRHPFYFTEWFLLVGLGLLTHSWVVFGLLAATLVIDPIVTLFEERELGLRFGNEYEEYRRTLHVRRRRARGCARPRRAWARRR
jgi:protein-S-isoprenylcysteine O-methyltransferase Ste14